MTAAPDVAPAASRPTGPTRPVPFVTAPERGLRSFRPEQRPWVWFVGCHGGAGETTLAQLLPSAGAADHRWPATDEPDPPAVVLVARTSAAGLLAARIAATQWASGSTPAVQLLGLVLSADIPGRTPKPLRQLAEQVAGGVPRVWHLPWIDAWRTGDTAAPKVTAALFADIAHLTES